MQATFKTARKYGSKIAAVASASALTLFTMGAAHADGLTDVIDSVDLTGLQVKILAAALTIVAVALTFKGPDLAKRVIRKV